MVFTQHLLQFSCVHGIMESEVLFTYLFIFNQRPSALDFSLPANVQCGTIFCFDHSNGMQNINHNPAR